MELDPKVPGRFRHVCNGLRIYNAEEVIAGYANMQALKKERMELDEERRKLEDRIMDCKYVFH